jgi:hypothetical protein
MARMNEVVRSLAATDGFASPPVIGDLDHTRNSTNVCIMAKQAGLASVGEGTWRDVRDNQEPHPL